MKNKLIIPILTLLISLSAWSQQPSRERIKALKVAHITKKLDLSSEEAQQFWPVYNAFDVKVTGLRNGELRGIKQKIRRSAGSLSSKEAENILNRLMVAEKELHEARVLLVNDLRKVLSAEKIIRLKAAEDEFNTILLQKLKELRERRQQRRN